jgi:MOSC domain-containing protein YiiM
MSIIKTFHQFGRPGVYFRVLKEGRVKVGDQLEILKKSPTQIPFSVLIELENKKTLSLKTAAEVLKIPDLSARLRQKIEALVAK